MSVESIVAEVGYENASYFHKIFKNKTGMSPLKFRAHVHKKNPI
jgi:YesN/AraC family two-component response regulator